MPDSTAGPAPPDPAAALAGAARNVSRQELIAINWIRFSTATFLVSLHLVVRWRQIRTLLSVNPWILFAWACALTMTILQTDQMNAL